ALQAAEVAAACPSVGRDGAEPGCGIVGAEQVVVGSFFAEEYSRNGICYLSSSDEEAFDPWEIDSQCYGCGDLHVVPAMRYSADSGWDCECVCAYQEGSGPPVGW